MQNFFKLKAHGTTVRTELIAGLTTFISVAGRSLAIEANSDKAGISRRVSDDERKRLKKVMGSLDVPDGHGAIMRTAAADQTDGIA